METRNATLSFSSFVFLAFFTGMTGGLALGAGYALLALFQADWFTLAYAIPVGAIAGGLVCVLYAVLGYLPYRWLVRRYPQAAQLTGVFGAPERP